MSNDEVGRDTRHRVLVVIEPVTIRIVGAGQIDPSSAAKLQNSAHEASRGHAVVPTSGPASLPCCSYSHGMEAAAIVGSGLGQSPGPTISLLPPIPAGISGLNLDLDFLCIVRVEFVDRTGGTS